MTDIPEIDKNESLAYWKEILAGAEKERDEAYKDYMRTVSSCAAAHERWASLHKTAFDLRAKVREMEESQ